MWRLVDAQERKVCEWEFLDGRRHGKSAWWYPNGQPLREIHYEDGVIQGEILEWDAEGHIVTQDRFNDGRRLVERVETYPSGQKESSGTMLYPKLTLKEPDDWWECRLAQYEQQGKPQKHGQWTVWYENGQQKLVGNYEFDQPVNKFVWWHPNGQKALEGEYQGGKKSGIWTWWHDNGLKSIQGEYIDGHPLGSWTWWNDAGKVAQRADFTGGQPSVIAHGAAISGQTGRSPYSSPALSRPPALSSPPARSARGVRK
jgi:antitoxin component YwqK of YwqJK toxin-antitoxin module